jgi:hypothetical protein
LSGCVGDPGGGTVGLVSGLFGGIGFEDGLGNSGALGAKDGDVGGVGMGCVQPAVTAARVIAARAIAANVSLGTFILAPPLKDSLF